MLKFTILFLASLTLSTNSFGDIHGTAITWDCGPLRIKFNGVGFTTPVVGVVQVMKNQGTSPTTWVNTFEGVGFTHNYRHVGWGVDGKSALRPDSSPNNLGTLRIFRSDGCFHPSCVAFDDDYNEFRCTLVK